jgi:hypothetical protein
MFFHILFLVVVVLGFPPVELMWAATGPYADVSQDPEELAHRESDLKEKALRNKVVRSRKRTTSNPDSSSTMGSSRISTTSKLPKLITVFYCSRVP